MELAAGGVQVAPVVAAVAAAVAAAEGVVEAAVACDTVWTGMGFRREVAPWVLGSGSPCECIEITAEHFFEGSPEQLHGMRSRFPVFVHGIGLSLGTPGPIHPEVLGEFKRVVDIVDPVWISEHICYTRAAGVDLGHLNPVPRTPEMARTIADHAKEVSDLCQKPIILENITTHFDPGGSLSEVEFINRVLQLADCGLLLDVTNLYINAGNFGFDAGKWLAEIDSQRVAQLHIVGYHEECGVLHDSHAARIQEPLFDLLARVLHASPVRAVILERDERLGEVEEIENELSRIKEVVADARRTSVA